jgi:hypothetical protein
MRPGSRDSIVTVEQAVQRAARACDPDGAEGGVTALVESFEGDERPATAAEDLAGELRSAARQIDPEGLDPAVPITAATANWLATNPADGERPERAIREGARLFFAEDAPAPVSKWLEARGLS